MAPPLAQQTSTPRQRSLVGIIATVFLALIVITGLTVLIIWLVVKPKRLEYTIEKGSIRNYGFVDNHLNATFDFVMRANNPNRKISIHYDSILASVAYEDQTLAFTSVPAFFQPHRNATRLDMHLKAQNVSIYGDVGRDLSHEKSTGEVELEVKIKARVRFKVGRWKSNHRTMRIECSPVLVHFSSSKGFDRTYCNFDI